MTGTVETGRYALEVGAPSGTVISSAAQPKDGHPRALGRALKKRKSAGDAVGDAIQDGSEATAKAEEAVALFTTLAEGKFFDPERLSGEIDALVALVERLDRDGRTREALKLARAVSGLLALTMR